MLQEDFAPDGDKNQSARDLCFFFRKTSGGAADADARCGEKKGRAADQHGRPEDFGIQEGECDPHGKGVDAGCDGQHQHDGECEGMVGGGFRFFVPCLLNHVASDESQKAECNPVIHCLDIRAERHARQISGDRHQCLKRAEPEAGQTHFFRAGQWTCDTLADRNGKGVHRQADAENKNFDDTHFLSTFLHPE